MNKGSVRFELDLQGFDAMVDGMANQLDEAARPAAQAAAQVFYDEVLRNVRALKRKTGNLEKSIYHKFLEDESGNGTASYRVSWNAKKAPHARLVEFGHLQRYVYYQDEQGRIRPMVRPGMEGKPRPRSGGRNRAALDAYYVTLPNPVQVAARPFARPAMAKWPEARAAAIAELSRRLKGKS